MSERLEPGTYSTSWVRDTFPDEVAAIEAEARAGALDVVEAAREVCDSMVRDAGGDRWWDAHDRLGAALAAYDRAILAEHRP